MMPQAVSQKSPWDHMVTTCGGRKGGGGGGFDFYRGESTQFSMKTMMEFVFKRINFVVQVSMDSVLPPLGQAWFYIEMKILMIRKWRFWW